MSANGRSDSIVKFRVRITARPSKGAIVSLGAGPQVVIGRGAQATVRLTDDPKVSRHHAVLAWDTVEWSILNRSRAGTWVGDTEVRSERPLVPGEEIHVGGTTLVFEEDQEERTGMITTYRPAGADAAAGAGYDDQGLFHSGYSKMISGPSARPSLKGAVRAFGFSMLVSFAAITGGGVLFLTVLRPTLGGSFGGLVIATALALIPVLFYLVLYRALDRNGRIPLRNYLSCFVWGATAAGALSALLTSATGGLMAHLAWLPDRAVLTAVLVAPSVEETTKGLAVLLVFWLLSEQFDNAVSGLVLGAASGLGFALIENWYYAARLVSSGTDFATFASDGATRVLGCALLGHPIYTALTGLGFGLARELRLSWGKGLMVVVGGWGGAVFLHGAWNLTCLRFDPATQAAPLIILAGADAIFFLVALLLALSQERTMLLTHLSNEVRTGFIEAQELMAFRSLFGRERYVLAGRSYGTSTLRKELRRAQLDLAFRKWHLKHGDAERGDDVDQLLFDARVRIRDARNSINAAEGVLEKSSDETHERPAYVPPRSR